MTAELGLTIRDGNTLAYRAADRVLRRAKRRGVIIPSTNKNHTWKRIATCR